MSDERRKNRSDVPNQAATLYLTQAAEQHGVEALALTREDGVLVVGVGRVRYLEGLAALALAYGERVEASTEALDELTDRVTEGADLYTTRIEVGGKHHYLATLGRRLPRQREAARALGRILEPARKAS